jgi:hypothetical protein
MDRFNSELVTFGLDKITLPGTNKHTSKLTAESVDYESVMF